MARVGLWRLNSAGVSAIQSCYRNGKWANVASFCADFGLSRSTYYELIGRNVWFERATLEDKLRSFGLPQSEFDGLIELKSVEPSEAGGSSLTNGNLPREATSFVGRSQELAEIRRLLKSSALVTLTGPGGTGKTRLSLRLGNEHMDTLAGRVLLVELASIASPDFLVPTIAASLNMQDVSERTPEMALIEGIGSQSLLLILDNCEHLIEKTAEISRLILNHCENVKILATSRQRLGVTGEQVYLVPPLALPASDAVDAIHASSTSDALELFVDRAKLYRANYQLTDSNIHDAVALCRKLDGLPLAIEIAAAGLRSFSIKDLLERIDGSFPQLLAGDKSVAARHRTLQGLIDWSHELLNEHEKVLFRRLSVFAGGFTLQAAETVAARHPIESPSEIMELLAGLVDKSLVAVDHYQDDSRYQMLATIRQYAALKLTESDETELMASAHLNWCLKLSGEAERAIRVGENHGLWQKRLEQEHDNIRAALEWEAQETTQAEAAMLLASVLWRFWMVRGYSREGLAHLRKVMGRDLAKQITRTRVRALNAAGNLANNVGDYAGAVELYTQCATDFQQISTDSWNDRSLAAEIQMDIGMAARAAGDASKSVKALTQSRLSYEELLAECRQKGDTANIANALVGPGRMATELGDHAAARAYLQESLDLRRATGDPRETCMGLYDLTFVARHEGSYAEVRRLYNEILSIRISVNDQRGVALAYFELGEAARLEGDHAGAMDCYRCGADAFHTLGNQQHAAMCHEGLASSASALGETLMAIKHYSIAAAMRKQTGTPAPTEQRSAMEAFLHRAKQQLGHQAVEDAWEAGMTGANCMR